MNCQRLGPVDPRTAESRRNYCESSKFARAVREAELQSHDRQSSLRHN